MTESRGEMWPTIEFPVIGNDADDNWVVFEVKGDGSGGHPDSFPLQKIRIDNPTS